jgi:hypothetical protein
VVEIEKQLGVFNEYVKSTPEKEFVIQRIPGRGISATKSLFPSVNFEIEIEENHRGIKFRIYEQPAKEGVGKSSHGQWNLVLGTDNNVYISTHGRALGVEQVVEEFLKPILAFALSATSHLV